jgi:hypothetical protein
MRAIGLAKRRAMLPKQQAPNEMPWFGKLKKFASGKTHSMSSIRKSIAKSRRDGIE